MKPVTANRWVRKEGRGPNHAEFYLLGQQDAIGSSRTTCSKTSKRSQLVRKGDAFIGDGYVEVISFLFRPEDGGDAETEIELRERKMRMQMNLSEST
ncbi:hypothetical protein [Halopelagius longus]|uniref:Uncharacterized protein n=1 Tax=Halopelagius longus TaxID=1236180 RepID=A0A1H1E165_9EURY|nr:hypothetical protein [Halopelagius longus]RDI71539.1 hypothetical protein DWB78_07275 [Halopelagius longus]SDQ81866.1 hypothetical protein SAMN05216278_2660 [Halopelagius longus]